MTQANWCHSGVRGGQEYYEKDVIRDRERDRERDRKEEIKEDVQVTRIRSQSAHQSRNVKKRDMWTEVSKELVMKEAIERAGYQFEEKANHYYIMKYLEYVSTATDTDKFKADPGIGRYGPLG